MRLCVADWQPPHGQKSGQGYLHMGETSREEGSGHVQILYTQAVGGLHSDGSVSPPHRPRGMMAPGSDVGDFSRRRSPAPPTMLTAGGVVGMEVRQFCKLVSYLMPGLTKLDTCLVDVPLGKRNKCRSVSCQWISPGGRHCSLSQNTAERGDSVRCAAKGSLHLFRRVTHPLPRWAKKCDTSADRMTEGGGCTRTSESHAVCNPNRDCNHGCYGPQGRDTKVKLNRCPPPRPSPP